MISVSCCKFSSLDDNMSTWEANEKVSGMRHSAAHVLAQAVLEMFPESKLAVGLQLKMVFIMISSLPRTLIPEDLPILEKKMKHIVKQNQEICWARRKWEKSYGIFEGDKAAFQVELLEDFFERRKNYNFYENIRGDGTVAYVDM